MARPYSTYIISLIKFGSFLGLVSLVGCFASIFESFVGALFVVLVPAGFGTGSEGGFGDARPTRMVIFACSGDAVVVGDPQMWGSHLYFICSFRAFISLSFIVLP